MVELGINWSFLVLQSINLMLLVGWFILAIVALFMLRRRELPDTALAIWAAVIVIIPIGGALAFWIVSPGRRS
jgi:hypothetical protein